MSLIPARVLLSSTHSTSHRLSTLHTSTILSLVTVAASASASARTKTRTPALISYRPYSLFSSFKKTSNPESKYKPSTTSTSATTGNATSTTAAAATPAFNSANMTHQKSDQEWQAVLTPEQFRVLRQKGTEMAYTGEYTKNKEQGVYRCAGCQAPLYTSSTKFDACGWCSFYDAIPGAVGRHPDPDGQRIEIVCNACGGHLGHVFKGEGFGNPTDERHCVNSISLKFQPGDS